jgi:hypothetical protein
MDACSGCNPLFKTKKRKHKTKKKNKITNKTKIPATAPGAHHPGGTPEVVRDAEAEGRGEQVVLSSRSL